MFDISPHPLLETDKVSGEGCHGRWLIVNSIDVALAGP